MKKALLLSALGAALFVSQAARADDFTLYFTGNVGVQGISNGFSSPGVSDIFFSTNGTPSPGTFFGGPTETQINGISGTIIIGGFTYDIGSLDTGIGGSNDNLLADNYLGVLSPNKLDFDLTAVGNPNPDYSELMLSYNIVAGVYDYSFCNNSQCTISGVAGGVDVYAVGPGDPPAATPEPGSLALLGTSILGGAGILRRRFRA